MELAERFLLDALAYLECALGVVCYVLLKLVGSPYGQECGRRAWRLAGLSSALAFPVDPRANPRGMLKSPP